MQMVQFGLAAPDVIVMGSCVLNCVLTGIQRVYGKDSRLVAQTIVPDRVLGSVLVLGNWHVERIRTANARHDARGRCARLNVEGENKDTSRYNHV